MDDDYIQSWVADINRDRPEKISAHEQEILNSKQYKQEIKYLFDFSWDAIQTIRNIFVYSTRALNIYSESLLMKSTDDLFQSIVGIRDLINEGIYNVAKREIRYLIEVAVKHLIVDQERNGQRLSIKTQYLSDKIPRASIEVAGRIQTPFDISIDKEFKNEIKDVYYKSCAYVHPSQKQIEERLNNYKKGIYIGFETSKMLTDINKITFRAYDLILTLLFIGIGKSMSGDLFIQIYDSEPKWKFHKGKYIKQYSQLFDYKAERQK